MNRAVIFDLDGVIINSEPMWSTHEPPFLRSFLGGSIAEAIGSSFGLSISQVFEKAVSNGFTGDIETFHNAYDELAGMIYRTSPITHGMDSLIHELVKTYRIAVVSSAPLPTIDFVLKRLTNGTDISTRISVDNHPRFLPKPSPDGYIEAMRLLSVPPESTIIVEDSPTGVAAGIASHATVICYTEHLENPPASGAHHYVHNTDALRLVLDHFASSALK